MQSLTKTKNISLPFLSLSLTYPSLDLYWDSFSLRFILQDLGFGCREHFFAHPIEFPLLYASVCALSRILQQSDIFSDISQHRACASLVHIGKWLLQIYKKCSMIRV